MAIRYVSLTASLGLLFSACASTQQNTPDGHLTPSAIHDSSDTAPVAANTSAPRPMGSGKLTVASKPHVMPPVKAAGGPPTASVRDRTAAEATIGAPRSEEARSAAEVAFNEATIYMGNHAWTKAATSFREAIRNDGSVARYHAGLGQVLMIQHEWLDAQAAYTAAVLLDLDNPDYQKQLKRARSNR